MSENDERINRSYLLAYGLLRRWVVGKHHAVSKGSP